MENEACRSKVSCHLHCVVLRLLGLVFLLSVLLNDPIGMTTGMKSGIPKPGLTARPLEGMILGPTRILIPLASVLRKNLNIM